MSRMNVTVAQVGARHGYAIPAAFAEDEGLERFYTDACGNAGLGGLASRLGAALGRRKASARLSGRSLPASVQPITYTFERFSLSFARATSITDAQKSIRAKDAAFERFGGLIEKAGFGQATHFYSVMHEAGPAAEAARKRGLIVGADVCITPSWDVLLRAEQERFPDWERPAPTLEESLGSGVRHYRHMLDNCHFFVCPSLAVADDLVENHGAPRASTHIVPYSVSPRWLNLVSATEPKRILFAGSANLRKGIHHFAAAAKQLSPYGYEFVVAGEASETIRGQADCSTLTFLGRVPRSTIDSEFSRADLLVLPSIAEGSAGVTYEAMAAGLPQIVSRAAGSVARNDVDGLVLDDPDGASLAAAIAAISTDRERRECMSKSARAYAQEFGWDMFGSRLRSAARSGAASGAYGGSL